MQADKQALTWRHVRSGWYAAGGYDICWQEGSSTRWIVMRNGCTVSTDHPTMRDAKAHVEALRCTSAPEENR